MIVNKSVIVLLAVALLAGGSVARADDDRGPPLGGGPPHPPIEDPLHAKLFPPELIMGHQQELGLDAKQRDAIIKEIHKAQSQITELSWQLTAAAEELGKILDGPRVDEARAMAQAEKVMNYERDVKKLHLGLLIRIKNLLSDAQRAKLTELRKQLPPPPPGRGPGPGHP